MSESEDLGVGQPEAAETTGRFVVTFREDGVKEGLSQLKKLCGVKEVASTADYGLEGIKVAEAEESDATYFETLGIAVISGEDAAAMQAVRSFATEEAAIIAIEPEYVHHPLAECGYLSGYRDGVNGLVDKLLQQSKTPPAEPDSGPGPALSDTATATWGLQITRVLQSRFSGANIRVAVLDTGFDLAHPDFAGRSIVSASFIAGQAVQDKQGHGTHCIGTACGPKAPLRGPRYGVAYNSLIYVGKVLSNSGSGSDSGILAGIDWAVRNGCQVISMSLGADVRTPSVAYNTAGSRALNAGSLIIAAAGNNARRSAGNFGFVGIPANAASIMAVGAIDSNQRMADFSARSLDNQGGKVDIAGPGVGVYSSWPMPTRNRSISGTSMATPHVAGIAALYAEAFRARGVQLYQLLMSRARGLALLSVDVGAGLVQAP